MHIVSSTVKYLGMVVALAALVQIAFSLNIIATQIKETNRWVAQMNSQGIPVRGAVETTGYLESSASIPIRIAEVTAQIDPTKRRTGIPIQVGGNVDVRGHVDVDGAVEIDSVVAVEGSRRPLGWPIQMEIVR